MKSRILLLVALAAVLVMAMNPAHAAASKTYQAGSAGDVQALCEGDDFPAGTGFSIGGACFNLSTTSIHIAVHDSVAVSPGFWVGFEKADGSCAGVDDPVDGCSTFNFAGCGAVTVAVPAGAKIARVALDGVAFGPLDCPEDGFSTTGTITVS